MESVSNPHSDKADLLARDLAELRDQLEKAL